MGSAPKHASRKDRNVRVDPPNGSIPIKTEENTTGAEPAALSTTGFPTTRRPAPGTAPPLWLMRVWVVIRVAFLVELGMVLVVLPWTRAWTENNLLLTYPEVRFFLQNYFVRGLISGLGLIDIGLGIWEALGYRDPRRTRQPS